VSRIPPIVYYTVLRILAFAIPLAVLLLLGFNPIFSTFIAALLGFSVSLLLLRRPREAVSSDLYRVRHGQKETPRDDEDTEDAVLDAPKVGTAASDAASTKAADAAPAGTEASDPVTDEGKRPE
jgi:hypothetical protein